MSTTIIGIAAAAAWLYLIALRGGFWRVRDDTAGASSAPARAVVAVVPARDEADVIGRAIGSLLAQKENTVCSHCYALKNLLGVTASPPRRNWLVLMTL